jgi:hypothetical protein
MAAGCERGWASRLRPRYCRVIGFARSRSALSVPVIAGFANGSSDPESCGYGKLTAYPVIVQVTVPLGKAIGKRTSQNGDVPGSA